jgi:AraC-like DNA-binding protein
MKWITREKPKIDRLACPWLILRFIDQDAEIIYTPYEEVLKQAKKLNATPFDIPGVEFTHYGTECTFDYFIKKYKIKDKAVLAMDHHELSAQANGLWAISAGLSYNIKNDQDLLKQGLILYDALYSWAKYLQKEKHTQQPFEHLLLDLFNKYLKEKPGSKKKIPAWAQELKEIIQDHIDTNLSLKEISRDLEINPSYLSREFSKYFEDLSFGDYIRKLRIEKAKELIASGKYSLTEISYLTGFSDQSHFTRIFKKHTGENPLVFKRSNTKK